MIDFIFVIHPGPSVAEVARQGLCHQSNTASTQVETASQSQPLKSKMELRM